MKDLTRLVGRLASLAIRTELRSDAGRVNLIGLVMVFVLVVVIGGTFDGVQALVRIWRPDYEGGGPPPLALVAVLAAQALLCVVVVTMVNPLRITLRPRVSSRDIAELDPQIEGRASAPSSAAVEAPAVEAPRPLAAVQIEPLAESD